MNHNGGPVPPSLPLRPRRTDRPQKPHSSLEIMNSRRMYQNIKRDGGEEFEARGDVLIGA